MGLESKLDEIRGVFPHIDEMIYLGAAGSAPFSARVHFLSFWRALVFTASSSYIEDKD